MKSRLCCVVFSQRHQLLLPWLSLSLSMKSILFVFLSLFFSLSCHYFRNKSPFIQMTVWESKKVLWIPLSKFCELLVFSNNIWMIKIRTNSVKSIKTGQLPPRSAANVSLFLVSSRLFLVCLIRHFPVAEYALSAAQK